MNGFVPALQEGGVDGEGSLRDLHGEFGDVPSLDSRHEHEAATVDVQPELGHDPLGELAPAARLARRGHRAGLVADDVSMSSLADPNLDRAATVVREAAVERRLAQLTPAGPRRFQR
jgi:hypothetical protein